MRAFWISRRNPSGAARWHADILSRRYDQKADRRWQAWMNASPDNRNAFDRIGNAWDASALVGDRPALRTLLQDIDMRAREAAGGRRNSWVLQPVAIGMCCVLVLVLLLAGFWFWNPVTSEQTYVTAVGEQRVVTLEDRSSISLNTDTRVHVIYTRKARRVELESGEAVFSVASNPERPFVVQALQGFSRAVGTQYAVRISTPDAVDVAVLEGLVDVRPVAGDQVAATRLVAGQALSYSRSGAVSAIREADLDRIRGWQSQRLIFNDVALGEALTEFNRYRSTPVVLGSADLASRRISGVYRIGEEEAFLNALQQLYRVQVIRSEGQVTLK